MLCQPLMIAQTVRGVLQGGRKDVCSTYRGEREQGMKGCMAPFHGERMKAGPARLVSMMSLYHQCSKLWPSCCIPQYREAWDAGATGMADDGIGAPSSQQHQLVITAGWSSPIERQIKLNPWRTFLTRNQISFMPSPSASQAMYVAVWPLADLRSAMR